jgi:hypothetical protein
LIIKQTTTTVLQPVIFVVISILIVSLIYSSFSRSYVFAAISKSPIKCQVTPYPTFTECCQTTTDKKGIEIHWCTLCDNTDPPSHCGPRYPEQVARLRLPGITTEPPLVAPPNGSSQTVPGTIEQPPSTVKDNSNTTSPPSTSQRVFSPTGGCIPGGSRCSPCDPGLPGADCIRSGDWLPSCSAIGGGTKKLGPPDCINTAGGGGSGGGGTASPNGGAVEQPPSSIAPPTSETPIVHCAKNPNDPSCATKLKPKVDCTKNPDDPLCKTVGINPPPSDSANLAPDNNKNNNPPSTEDNKPKGSELGQSIGGGLSATKKGNKDNSPTPPPCPTDNSPIPPNCTLKPKF